MSATTLHFGQTSLEVLGLVFDLINQRAKKKSGDLISMLFLLILFELLIQEYHFCHIAFTQQRKKLCIVVGCGKFDEIYFHLIIYNLKIHKENHNIYL